MSEFQAVGARIAELRGKLTKQDFAVRLGVDRKTVERWEAGDRLPDGSKLLRLMTEFGADVNYILTGQRAGGLAPMSQSQGEVLAPDERTMLDNYRHAPDGVKAGVKTTLETFAPGSSAKRGKAA